MIIPKPTWSQQNERQLEQQRQEEYKRSNIIHIKPAKIYSNQIGKIDAPAYSCLNKHEAWNNSIDQETVQTHILKYH